MSEGAPPDDASGGRRLKADELIVTMADGNTLDTLEALGNAEVVQEDITARGDHIAIREAGDAIHMRGPGSLHGKRVPDEAEDGAAVDVSVAWTGNMTFDRAHGNALFRRGVVIRYGQRTLESDRVTARVVTEGDETRVSHFRSEGGTVLRDQANDLVAEGERLTWDVVKDEGRLVGMPASVSRAGNNLFGETIVFKDGGDEVRVKGRQRIQGRLRMDRNLGDLLP
jgi:lipopolysaccharide transport protein LptA